MFHCLVNKEWLIIYSSRSCLTQYLTHHSSKSLICFTSPFEISCYIPITIFIRHHFPPGLIPSGLHRTQGTWMKPQLVGFSHTCVLWLWSEWQVNPLSDAANYYFKCIWHVRMAANLSQPENTVSANTKIKALPGPLNATSTESLSESYIYQIEVVDTLHLQVSRNFSYYLLRRWFRSNFR